MRIYCSPITLKELKLLVVDPNVVWVKVSIEGVLSSLLLLVENVCNGIKTIENTACKLLLYLKPLLFVSKASVGRNVSWKLFGWVLHNCQIFYLWFLPTKTARKKWIWINMPKIRNQQLTEAGSLMNIFVFPIWYWLESMATLFKMWPIALVPCNGLRFLGEVSSVSISYLNRCKYQNTRIFEKYN